MPILIFTKNNEASANIAQMLIERHGFEESADGGWKLDDIRLLDTKTPGVLDVPVDFDTDLLVVLSSHKSKAGDAILTAHFPGNWGEAGMGGEPRTLNIAHGMLLKKIIRELDIANKRHGLGWPVRIEADHHGPTCDVPIIFVEIGSTEKEWKNEKAGAVVADAVSNALRVMRDTMEPAAPSSRSPSDFRTGNPKPETVFGVGGGHYAKEFTELELGRADVCIGHICPKYAIESLAEDTFRQAIEKNTEPVRRVLVLKDGTNAEQKEKVRGLCESFGVEYEER